MMDIITAVGVEFPSSIMGSDRTFSIPNNVMKNLSAAEFHAFMIPFIILLFMRGMNIWPLLNYFRTQIKLILAPIVTWFTFPLGIIPTLAVMIITTPRPAVTYSEIRITTINITGIVWVWSTEQTCSSFSTIIRSFGHITQRLMIERQRFKSVEHVR